MEHCKGQCEGCAFREGAAANLEIYNRIKGTISTLSLIPFFCHEGFDWKKYDGHELPPRDVAIPIVCSGWKQEVAKLNATGFYPKDKHDRRELKRLGTEATQLLNAAIESDDPDKSELYEEFGHVLKVLANGLKLDQLKILDHAPATKTAQE